MAYSLKKEILLHVPIQKVWTTYRDHLPTLAEVMPTVESITVIKRKETIKQSVLIASNKYIIKYFNIFIRLY